MTNTLEIKISDDVKMAMRSKNSELLATLRLLQAAIKQRYIDERSATNPIVSLDDNAIVTILDKMIKQRQDSIAAFAKAQRQDLLQKEQAEMLILQSYLPKRLEPDEIERIVQSIAQNIGAKTPADMGKLMTAAKNELNGKAQMSIVSTVVKKILSQ